MQVQKIQSNNINFGTKIKMNPSFIVPIDEKLYPELRKQIKILENNGNDDILHIFQRSYSKSVQKYNITIDDLKDEIHVEINKRHHDSGQTREVYEVYADVYKVVDNKLYMGSAPAADPWTIGKRGGDHVVNILDLYKKACEDMKPWGVYVRKLLNYI